MAYKVGTGCILCGACAASCPVSAIADGCDSYVIDPDVCIDCGACAAGCPVECIKQA
ncbi:4Fe-4S binding protein [Christensenella sp. MSJ-20]|uniref:DUF362 domain-containing protein n=1 Tax=Christensenella sp. MSJ-20 TaxID=2841518 RepID=UPI000D7A3939|nr:MAG: ferredoxin [Bacillota bacterium]QWT54827.1 4Fe-4S binding protein [Christensenella sp. MSJ-20]